MVHLAIFAPANKILWGGLFTPARACYRPSPTPHRGQSRNPGFSESRRARSSSLPGGRGELAMPKMPNGGPALALTFDDVLLRPGLSDVMPSDVDIRTRITREIPLN